MTGWEAQPPQPTSVPTPSNLSQPPKNHRVVRIAIPDKVKLENGNLTMLVAVLDGQLTLVPPGAPNPYAARVILEHTPELHTFIMRSSGAFATLPFGERFTFITGAGGAVTGYVTSGARYVREPVPRGIDRRRQPQAGYTGIERRAGGDRRAQQQHLTH